MRPLTAFVAIVLGLGLVFLAARLLFFIWIVAAIGGLFFFALRGMRSFVLERRPGYPEEAFTPRPYALPARQTHAEPLVPDNIRYLNPRFKERIIEVR